MTRNWPPSESGLWTAEPFDAANREDRTNPNFYSHRAGYWGEQVMRADFARYSQLRESIPYADTDEEIGRLLSRAEQIATRWRGRESGLGSAWAYLENAVADWRRAPEVMHRLLDDAGHEGGLQARELRDQQQARELTGNGVWEIEPNPGAVRPDITPVGVQRAAALRATAAYARAENQRSRIQNWTPEVARHDRSMALEKLRYFLARYYGDVAGDRLRGADPTDLASGSELADALYNAQILMGTWTSEDVQTAWVELTHQYHQRYGLVLETDGVRAADDVDGARLQAVAEVAAAEARRTAVVEHATAAVDPVIGEHVAATFTDWATRERGGIDPATNRRRLVDDLVGMRDLSRSDREHVLFIADYLGTTGHPPDLSAAPVLVDPGEEATARINEYLTKYAAGDLPDLDTVWQDDLALLAPHDKQSAIALASEIAGYDPDWREQDFAESWPGGWRPDHVQRDRFEQIVRSEYTQAYRALDEMADRVFREHGELDTDAYRVLSNVVSEARFYLDRYANEGAEGMTDLERAQLRLTLTDLEVGHRDLPEMLFADERSGLARAERAHLADNHTRVNGVVDVLAGIVATDPMARLDEVAARAMVMGSLGDVLDEGTRVRNVEELIDIRTHYSEAFGRFAQRLAENGITHDTWRQVHPYAWGALDGMIEQAGLGAQLRREWSQRTVNAIAARDKSPTLAADTDEPGSVEFDEPDAPPPRVIDRDLGQLLEHYGHLNAIADAVRTSTQEVDLFAPVIDAAESVYDEIRLRLSLLDDPAEFRHHTRMLASTTRDASPSGYQEADDDTLAAAYAEHERAAHVYIPAPLPGYDELFADDPESRRSQSRIDRIADDFIVRMNLGTDVQAAWGAVEYATTLGERAAAELPEWTAHLGPVPEGAVSRAEWIDAAGQIATWREYYNITDPTSMLGEQPDDDRAQAWQDLNDYAGQLRALAVEETTGQAEHENITAPENLAERIAEGAEAWANPVTNLDEARAALDYVDALGERAAAERPEWTTHLGPPPDGAVSRNEWINLAGQVAAWRDDHGITSHDSLLGACPDDDDRAHTWDDLNDHAGQLRSRSAEEKPLHAEQEQQRQREIEAEQRHRTMTHTEGPRHLAGPEP